MVFVPSSAQVFIVRKGKAAAFLYPLKFGI